MSKKNYGGILLWSSKTYNNNGKDFKLNIKPVFLDHKPTLKDYYELLDCDLIDHTIRKIGGKYYDIVVDDEGLLKPNLPTLASYDLQEVLVGKCLLLDYKPNSNDFVWFKPQYMSDNELISILSENTRCVYTRDNTKHEVMSYDF